MKRGFGRLDGIVTAITCLRPRHTPTLSSREGLDEAPFAHLAHRGLQTLGIVFCAYALCFCVDQVLEERLGVRSTYGFVVVGVHK